jgi:hypothetical protein
VTWPRLSRERQEFLKTGPLEPGGGMYNTYIVFFIFGSIRPSTCLVPGHGLKSCKRDALWALGVRVSERAEELAVLESESVGEPLSQARGDIKAVVEVFKYFAGVLSCHDHGLSASI